MKSESRSVPPIRGAIFDVGNVLIQLRPIEKIVASFSALAGPTEGSPSTSFDPLARLRSDPVIDRFERGQASDGEFFEAVRRAFDIRLGDAEIRKVYEEILGDPMPGMSDLVRELLGRELRVVGLTDISPGHLTLIARYPAVKSLQAVVASCHTTYRKPEPEAFRAALEAAGTRPEETFFTDDQPANVEGARKLGIQATVFTNADDLRSWLRL